MSGRTAAAPPRRGSPEPGGDPPPPFPVSLPAKRNPRRCPTKRSGAGRSRSAPSPSRYREPQPVPGAPSPPPSAALAWLLSNCSRSASRLCPPRRLSTRAGTLLMLFMAGPRSPGSAPRAAPTGAARRSRRALRPRATAPPAAAPGPARHTPTPGRWDRGQRNGRAAPAPLPGATGALPRLTKLPPRCFQTPRSSSRSAHSPSAVGRPVPSSTTDPSPSRSKKPCE